VARQRQARPKPHATAEPCAHARPCSPHDRSCRESRP
jgi:hypothetical protein